jgi:hypothetical protein
LEMRNLVYTDVVSAFGRSIWIKRHMYESHSRNPYMFSCLTKLEKLLCLKKRGRSSFPTFSELGTDSHKLITLKAQDQASSLKKESPLSAQYIKASVSGSETILPQAFSPYSPAPIVLYVPEQLIQECWYLDNFPILSKIQPAFGAPTPSMHTADHLT